MKKGSVTFDGIEDDEKRLSDPNLWWAVFKNTRAGIMPPAGKPRPDSQDQQILENWIKSAAFGIDAKDPDPGSVTVRRLNRVEYRNTIRDLIGVDYDTVPSFRRTIPVTGSTISAMCSRCRRCSWKSTSPRPNFIVSKAVPRTSRAVERGRFPVARFAVRRDASATTRTPRARFPSPITIQRRSPCFSGRDSGRVSAGPGSVGDEKFVEGVFDYNKCRLLFKADGQELLRQEYSRQEGKPYPLRVRSGLEKRAASN